jgi:hypothetical protein
VLGTYPLHIDNGLKVLPKWSHSQSVPVFKEKPGPLVAVITFFPVKEAPMTAPIPAIFIFHLNKFAPYLWQAFWREFPLLP